MYIFGGLEGITHETNDFYCFDFNKETWTTIQLKISNPENIKPSVDSKESQAHNSNREERKKSLSKVPNMSLYGMDNRKILKRHPSNSRGRDQTRNNKFLGGSVTDREKFSKTFFNSPLRGLLTNIVIPK